MKVLAAALVAASPLNVFGASSLADVLPRIDRAPRYQFGGSNQLAFQIREGAPADVYLAASPREPRRLHAAGLCSKPVSFATNTIVLVVPRANRARIHTVQDLRRRGVRLVIGARGVPIGDYTRRLLAGLRLTSVLRSVVSEETDVKLVVTKVALGEADAGFVYRTDVKPVGARVLRIPLPPAAQPTVRYELCVPTATERPEAARAFVRRVLSSRGRATLRAAGFGVP